MFLLRCSQATSGCVHASIQMLDDGMCLGVCRRKSCPPDLSPIGPETHGFRKHERCMWNEVFIRGPTRSVNTRGWICTRRLRRNTPQSFISLHDTTTGIGVALISCGSRESAVLECGSRDPAVLECGLFRPRIALDSWESSAIRGGTWRKT